jgi:hypothetical protein
MNYYLVFGMTKTQDEPTYVGRSGAGGAPHFIQAPPALVWNPLGVFTAATAEDACKAAAKKAQRFGSFFAVEGYPWGIDLMDTDATEFGAEPLTNLQRAENRSRELEREAGLND